MISVDEAWQLISENLSPVGTTTVSINDAFGRVLAEPVRATVSHPPAALSAMDGYAVAWSGPLAEGVQYKVVGEAAAGSPFSGDAGTDAVRVFTGSVIPRGASHVIIQEHVDRSGDMIALTQAQDTARNIRVAGSDFHDGQQLVASGHRLSATDCALIAAAGVAEVEVFSRPRVGVFANGDELVSPGHLLADGQVYNSVPSGIVPLLRSWGAVVEFVGTAGDQAHSVDQILEACSEMDLVVPIGGASVGDYDVVQSSAAKLFDPVFSKVAVKPGKPVWFSKRGKSAILGLPGNPASAFVCTHLFVKLALRTLAGEQPRPRLVHAKLPNGFPQNGAREQFVRAEIKMDNEGQIECHPLPKQDSSLLSTMSKAQGLLRLRANAASAEPGSSAEVLLLDGLIS